MRSPEKVPTFGLCLDRVTEISHFGAFQKSVYSQKFILVYYHQSLFI